MTDWSRSSSSENLGPRWVISVPTLRFAQVHKVFPNGLAAQEGTIQKGNEVLSINGKSLKGATHNDALAILRQARDPRQAVIVTRKPTPEAVPDLSHSTGSVGSASVASDTPAESSKCSQLRGGPWHQPWGAVQ